MTAASDSLSIHICVARNLSSWHHCLPWCYLLASRHMLISRNATVVLAGQPASARLLLGTAPRSRYMDGMR